MWKTLDWSFQSIGKIIEPQARVGGGGGGYPTMKYPDVCVGGLELEPFCRLS